MIVIGSSENAIAYFLTAVAPKAVNSYQKSVSISSTPNFLVLEWTTSSAFSTENIKLGSPNRLFIILSIRA